METSIHDVNDVKITDIREMETSENKTFSVREIIIKTVRGEELIITMYADIATGISIR